VGVLWCIHFLTTIFALCNFTVPRAKEHIKIILTKGAEMGRIPMHNYLFGPEGGGTLAMNCLFTIYFMWRGMGKLGANEPAT
jgi:hypothetical protein